MKRVSFTSPWLLAGLFLAGAWVGFAYLRRTPVDRGPEEVALPGRPIPAQFFQRRDASPLERAPGPPAEAPTPPGLESDKAELWAYGQSYLGWEERRTEELDRFSSEELHAWLEDDRRLYGYE